MWDERPFASQDFCSLRDAGLATDTQLAFLVAGSDGGRPWTHVEQIVLDAPSLLLAPERLRAAWQELAERHEALRMVLRADETGNVRLLVSGRPLVDLRQFDWSHLSRADELDQEQKALLAADRDEGADPSNGPGWRVTCIDLGKGRGRLVWTIHHALIDGTSMEIVLAELWALLNHHVLAAPFAPEFVEAAARLRQVDKNAAQDVFARMLAPAEQAALFNLPAANEPARMAHLCRTLDEIQSQAIRAAAARVEATPLNVVQAVWALVLARWTGQPGACFGLVDSGRSQHPDLQQTVGCLISTVPLQITLPGTSCIGDLLVALRRLTLEMRPHAQASPTDIRRWSGRSGAVPLFDTVLLYARGTLGAQLSRRGCGWSDVRLIEEGGALATLSVYDDPQLQVILEHDPSRLTPDRAERMMGHVVRLLAAIGQADPDTLLSDLGMLDQDETLQLLATGQPLPMTASGLPCIATRFEMVARARPDQPAVIEAASDRQVSFGVLDGLANGLVWQLSDMGLGPENVVAVALPRGIDHITAMLAVLKAGAAFLALDVEQPLGYLVTQMQSVGARALIGPADLAAALPDVVHVLPLGTQRPDAPPRPVPQHDRLAYLIHTSGSTGRPKAVMGMTGALSAHADAVRDCFALTDRDRVLQFASLSFDVMLEEVWPTLLAGATVVTRDARPIGSIAGLLELVEEQGVTVLNLPASYWHQMVLGLADQPQPLPSSLRLLVTGSERISPTAFRQWRDLAPGIDFINGYGPTETTVTCTAWRSPPDHQRGELPIGRPLGHALALLRAPDGTLTPEGGEGLLWIGGAAVTRGYFQDEVQTSAAFGPDPWHPGGRLYGTGDRARWREDGQLMFLGRNDRQIKLRGHRIDLAQIEAALARQPGIRQAHVDLDARPPARLLAWVLCDEDNDLALTRRRLEAQLPGYMVPRLIPVTHLPTTQSGKIDSRSLPRPEPEPVHKAEPASTDASPDEDQAGIIAACMSEVLDGVEVPLDAAFHDLGGDSLLALRLAGLIRNHTGWQIQATDLLRHPTPLTLALMMREGGRQGHCLVPVQPGGRQVPIFAVHVLGRNQELFRPLSAALGPDYPLHGLTVGIPEDLRQIDVRRTARTYFKELQTSFPNQPVCLIAVSMAAYFAFELAQLLRAAGREVRVLAILDAMGPGGRPSLTGWPKLRAHMGQIRRHGIGHVRCLAGRMVPRHPEAPPQAQDLPDMNALIEANVAAVSAYAPRPYDGKITVFRADSSFWDAPEALASGLGWASVAQRGIELHDLPGDHLSILQPGNVEVLAKHLQRLIVQAEDADHAVHARQDAS